MYAFHAYEITRRDRAKRDGATLSRCQAKTHSRYLRRDVLRNIAPTEKSFSVMHEIHRDVQ